MIFKKASYDPFKSLANALETCEGHSTARNFIFGGLKCYF